MDCKPKERNIISKAVMICFRNEFSVVICVKKVKVFHQADLQFSLPDIKQVIEMYAIDRFWSCYFGLTAGVEL